MSIDGDGNVNLVATRYAPLVGHVEVAVAVVLHDDVRASSSTR